MSHARKRALVGNAVWLTCAVALGSLSQPTRAAETMDIKVKVFKTSLLVGEPLVVAVSVKTSANVALEKDLTWPNAALKVLVDRGQGFVPYLEKRWTSGWRDPGKGPLGEGGVTLEHVLSYDDNLKDWVFPAPGTYRVQAEYVDDVIGPFRSNVVTVTVQASTGDEKTVHDALRGIGPQALGVHQPSRLGRLRPLVESFPRSVYLQEPRLNDLNSRLGRVMSGYHPDEAAAAGTPDNPPPGPDLRPAVIRDRLTALLPDAEAAAEVPGPFQPEALLILAGLYNSTGNDEAARATYQRIVHDFPDREAARLALEEVGDTTPPTLQVSASPSSLWPPNHKLVPVTVAVSVTDEVDPNPVIKLVSITCDDGCGPASDIAGATLNTDDRDFQLRAERTGGGAGRTYTITYSATDVSRNTATARATVIVPHDQR